LITFQQLAELVGAKLVGAEAGACAAELARVSSLEDASADAIVFASDARALSAALASNAGAILASRRLDPTEPAPDTSTKDVPSTEWGGVARVLRVADPRYAFALAARSLRGSVEREGVHPSAVLGHGVSVGQGTTIGPHVVIDDGVRIGDACVIGANVTIQAGTTLGDYVVVQAGAVLGATGFGYARDPEGGEYLLFPQQGTLVIEDHVDIGANTTLDRGALGETRIGRGTKIDNLVHVGHNCVIGRDVIIAAQTGISGSSVIEDGAILGGQVGIGEHATVGRGVILGGGAGVLSGKKMQGSGQVFWGRPARPLKEYLRDLARLRGGRTGAAH